jgi:1-deoxy-D-xylulose-5-phosphate synthase
LLVTVEENTIKGGAGSAVGEVLDANNLLVPLLSLGLPDRFLEHGRASDMLAACGLDAAGIENSIRKRLAALL